VHNSGNRAEGTDGSVSPRHTIRVWQLSVSSNAVSINNDKMRRERKRKLANMRGGFQDGLVGGKREGRFFAGLQAHSFVFYSEWACADRSGFTDPLYWYIRKWITPLLRSSFGNRVHTRGTDNRRGLKSILE
jgi:hypothetical protein